jgi:hypothetical protein
MGKVLVEASKVTCSHQGRIGMTGAARLTVGDRKVLTTASVLGPATETPFPECSNAGGPCTKILSMTDGAATCLMVDGKFVVLDSLKAATDRAGGAVTVDSTSINNSLLEAQ